MSFDADEVKKKIKKVTTDAVEKRAAAAQSAFDRVFSQYANGDKATIEAALTTALAGTGLKFGGERIARYADAIASGKRVRIRTDLSALDAL
jgi:hypothetical protein